MKIAIIGNGKTGSKVAEVSVGHEVIVYDSQNTPTTEDLQKCDVAICFLPGSVFEQYIDMLIDAQTPAVIGATGSNWQDGLNERLIDKQVSWVYASNFAATMPLVKELIEQLSIVDTSIQPVIEETHHIDKVDSPSGTALSWQEWLGKDVKFIDYREADTYGVHKLTVETDHEVLSIEHTAKDRAAFAQGALEAAERLVAGHYRPGLTNLLC